jgi:hypothetical protein
MNADQTDSHLESPEKTHKVNRLAPPAPQNAIFESLHHEGQKEKRKPFKISYRAETQGRRGKAKTPINSIFLLEVE